MACEIVWLCSLLQELRVSLLFTPNVWCDNITGTTLAYNPVFHAHTKHIEIDAHFIRDQVLASHIDIRHIASMNKLLTVSQNLIPWSPSMPS